MSTGLCIPHEILSQHAVWLGKTGAGKSSAMRHVVEWLLAHNKRVCILDPKGDWWGLKSSADGNGEGLPVVLFGDFKKEGVRDIPISDRSGKQIAELVASGNRPCVIGFSGWTQGAMTRFWIDFAETLFAKNRGELYLVGDEFHNQAPKQWKGQAERDTPVGVGLHWANRILSEGRGLGIVCLIASQRPQKVHNDTLTSCETLVAMRVVHAADRAAVEAWIDGNGDPAVGKQVIGSLAGMPRGEAWVWSPEVGFGPKRVAFPMFHTFDSFAPPQLQKRVNQEGWADVDLDSVKEKLAHVIAETEANDPRLLKQQITELKRELAKQKPTVEAKEVSILTAQDRHMIENAVKVSGKVVSKMETENSKLIDAIADIKRFLSGVEAKLRPTPVVPCAITTRPQVRSPALVRQPAESQNGDIGKAERALLTAAVMRHPRPSTKAQLSILSGYSITSSSFANALGGLRSRGYIVGQGDSIHPSDAGIEAAGDVPPIPTGPELHQFAASRLGKAERALLDAIIEAHPNAISKDELAERSGYSVTSSSFANALGKLRTLELVTRGEIRASDDFFQ